MAQLHFQADSQTLYTFTPSTLLILQRFMGKGQSFENVSIKVKARIVKAAVCSLAVKNGYISAPIIVPLILKVAVAVNR